MDDQPQPTPKMPDPSELSKSLAEIAVRSQRLMADYMRRHLEAGAPPEVDPMNVGEAFMQMTAQMVANPAHIVQSNLNLWQDYSTLSNNSVQRMLGENTAPVIEPRAGPRAGRRWAKSFGRCAGHLHYDEGCRLIPRLFGSHRA